MADDLSLLFRLRAQNQASPAINQLQGDIAKLRKSFGPELAASVAVGQKALQSVGGSVENLVSRQLPLLGTAVVSVSNGLRQITTAATQSQSSVTGVGLSFAEIGAIAGRTEAQVAGFVTSLGLLKTEAARNTATVGFLGGALASTLRPQLDEAAKAGAELNKTLQASGKSTSEALRLVQTLGLIGDATQRSAAAVAFFGEATAKKLLPQLERFGTSLGVIAVASGRSGTEVAEFVARFGRLGTEVEKRTAAVEFFGAALATKLGPELSKTSAALGGVSAASTATGTSIAAMAGPIGVAVLAVAALSAGAVIAAREIFDLARRAADFQGRMIDLAQQTGVAVETLSALEVVARRSGGELGNLTQALVGFQRQLDAAQNPLSKTAELFRKYDIDISNTETSLRSAFIALARMPEGFAQTNAAAELFGARGGKQILAILKETNGDLDGTIERFRELGFLITEEDARAADQFNDEMETLNFQLRAASAALVRELIPSLTEVVRSFRDVVRAARPFTDIAARIAGVTGRALESTFLGLSVTVQALTGDIQGLNKSLKELEERKNIPALKVPDLTVPLPKAPSPLQSATDAANQADALVAIVKRSVAEQNQALAELFQTGRRNRQQQAEETIADNKRILEAEKQRIDAQLTLKEQEIKALDEAQVKRGEIVRRDTEDYRAITKEIGKLQQERLDKEGEFNVKSRELRATAAKEQADAEREQASRNTDAIIAELDRQIRLIEAAGERRSRIEPTTFPDLSERFQEERKDFDLTQALEKSKIDLRIEGLEEQKRIGQLSVEEQRKINAQINQLNQEADRLAEEHLDRRIAIRLEEVERLGQAAQLLIDAEVARANSLLQAGQISDQSRIASIRALTDLRVKTEEQAEREILEIKLAAIEREKDLAEIAVQAVKVRNDAEIEAIKARRRAVDEEQKKAAAIDDPLTRARVQAALVKEQQALADTEIAAIKNRDAEVERAEAERNNNLRVLNAERQAIQSQGERDIEEGRQRDLENERRYADELEDIKRRIRDIERDVAEEVIRLMQIHFASRRDVIRARLRLDLEDEEERHLRALQAIDALKAENRESNKTQQEKLEVEKELNRLREAEAERHRLAMQGIKDTGRRDEIEAGPFGGFVTGLESGQLAELENGVQSFADVAKVAFSAVGAVVNGLAQGVGNLVQQWVLLGTTGPGAFRKLVASVLAGVAAQAATLAIMELAYGIAALTPWGAAIYGPAPFHFKSAALFGSIALATGLAGRAVAGGLFQSGAGAAGSSARGGGAVDRRTEPRPIDLARTQQNQRLDIFLHTEPGRGFGQEVVRAIVDDVRSNGDAREVIIHTAKES